MPNNIEKIETQTTYNIEFEGNEYTVVYLEDADLSGRWEITQEPIQEDDEFDEDILLVHNPIITPDMESRIVEYMIENM